MRNNIFTIHLWLYEALKGMKVVATWSVSHKTHKLFWEIENFSRFRLPQNFHPPLVTNKNQYNFNYILSLGVFVPLRLISMEYLATHSNTTSKIRDKQIFSQRNSTLFMRKLLKVYTGWWVWLWGRTIKATVYLAASWFLQRKRSKDPTLPRIWWPPAPIPCRVRLAFHLAKFVEGNQSFRML